MVDDISPRDSLEHALRFWWVIALAMVIGGVAGWVIARFSTPVYEAWAGYRVTLDEEAVLAELQKTKPNAELTYEVRAPYLTPVAVVFFLPEVRSEVQERAQGEGLDFPLNGFKTGQLIVMFYVIQGDSRPGLVMLWIVTAMMTLFSNQWSSIIK